MKAALESETQSFEIGDVVFIKQSATRYYPGGPTIPDWVKESYHKITGILYAGKEVVKGGKPCVLLGKKINKKTGEETAGILTWTAVDELTLVESDDDTTGDGKYYKVQVGAFSKQENAENLVKELTKAGFKSYITYE
nr:SPOR domain-containing protein [Alkalibacter rhizosphaerae]